MSAAAADPNQLGHDALASRKAKARGHGTGGPAAKRVVVGFGFWIFLISDIVMFSGFFAAYAVLRDATAGGPTAKELFDLKLTAIQTALLLCSTFACGMASLAAEARRQLRFQIAMAITGVLGAAFVVLEVHEFIEMVAEGAGPTRSAFLSAFFTLVGCHGLHVTIGILWLLTMMAQVWAKGFRADIRRRILCFALFWHALDIVWVALFTTVYLLGVAA